MFSYAWQRMLGEMEATLNIYPNVKGIQVMNDMGNYLFSPLRWDNGFLTHRHDDS
jgi:hypothetical protein